MPDEPCLWGKDEDGVWETSCGNLHEFIEGDPADNYYLFCPYCGKPLKTLVYEDEETDE
jgi:hypothetical protein